MIADILIWVIPALLMILVTQLTRHMLVRYVRYYNGHIAYTKERPAICNGFRWVLILLALIPIANIVALCFEICFIVAQYVENEIEFKNRNDSKFLTWWRK